MDIWETSHRFLLDGSMLYSPWPRAKHHLHHSGQAFRSQRAYSCFKQLSKRDSARASGQWSVFRERCWRGERTPQSPRCSQFSRMRPCLVLSRIDSACHRPQSCLTRCILRCKILTQTFPPRKLVIKQRRPISTYPEDCGFVWLFTLEQGIDMF
jgi:hypothetical protein